MKHENLVLSSYWFYHSYGPASAFFAKPLMKFPYEGASGAVRPYYRKIAVRLYYKSVRPRMLKIQADLSPNWSYDKILTKLGGTGHGARTSLRSVRTYTRPKYFPIRPSHLVNT